MNTFIIIYCVAINIQICKRVIACYFVFSILFSQYDIRILL